MSSVPAAKKLKREENKYFELPVLNRMNHAPFVYNLPNEEGYVVVWFSGEEEGLKCRISFYESKSKSTKIISRGDDSKTHQNPVFFIHGETWYVFYVEVKNRVQRWFQTGSASIVYITSKDFGATWSEASPLCMPGSQNKRGLWIAQPIFVAETSWILPAYRAGNNRSIAVFLESRDEGKSWRAMESEAVEGEGKVQGVLLRNAGDSSIEAYFRDRKGRRIYCAKVDLNRPRAKEFVATSMPNPNSRFAACSVEGKGDYIVCNPTAVAEEPRSINVTVGPRGGIAVDKAEAKWEMAQRFPLALYHRAGAEWRFVKVLFPCNAAKPEPASNCVHKIHSKDVDALEYPSMVYANGSLRIAFAANNRLSIMILEEKI